LSKKKKIVINKKIVLLVIIALIIVYAIYTICNLIKKPTDTFLVENGKLSSEQTMQGYVIREETVIKGENYKNGMERIKAEGEKVAAGEAIFRYYTSGEDDLIKKIQELDIKIAESLEKEENSVFNTDIKTIENQIQEKINDVYKLNDLQKIKEYKENINNYITKKARVSGELSPAGSYLKELIEQRSSYENRLNEGSEYLKATKAGVVSYRVDGLEEILTPENFGNLSKKKLEELKLKIGQVVSTSEESAKIINNFECYIAFVIDTKNIQDLEQGDTLKIRLSNNQQVNARVEYISKESENEKLVVLKIEKCVEELINYRKISFDILWWDVTGLKVPNEAIKQENEELSYVIRKRNGYTDKIYVKILKENEKYSIIENYTMSELIKKGLKQEEIEIKYISLYDEIIL